MPDEDKNFGGALVLDFRKRWRHVKTIYIVRVSFITRVLNFAIFSKSRKSRNLVLAKFSENKVDNIGLWIGDCFPFKEQLLKSIQNHSSMVSTSGLSEKRMICISFWKTCMTLIRQFKPREQKRQYFNLDLTRLGVNSDLSIFLLRDCLLPSSCRLIVFLTEVCRTFRISTTVSSIVNSGCSLCVLDNTW